MEFRDRLAEALRISNKTRRQLAEEIGISPVAISHWFTGKVQGIRGTTAAKIEAITGVRATWLATGEGPKLVQESEQGAVASQGMRHIPCIAGPLVNAWLEGADPYASNTPPHWLLSNRPLSARAFAFTVNDEAMRPGFSVGDQVIIDPEISPLPGDFVIAEARGVGSLLRKYRPRSMNADGVQVFELAPVNDDYPVILSTETDVRLQGTIVEHRRYFRV